MTKTKKIIYPIIAIFMMMVCVLLVGCGNSEGLHSTPYNKNGIVVKYADSSYNNSNSTMKCYIKLENKTRETVCIYGNNIVLSVINYSSDYDEKAYFEDKNVSTNFTGYTSLEPGETDTLTLTIKVYTRYDLHEKVKFKLMYNGEEIAIFKPSTI